MEQKKYALCKFPENVHFASMFEHLHNLDLGISELLENCITSFFEFTTFHNKESGV